MRNIKLIIEYDGKGFNGWQKQPNKLNIQGEIEKTIGEITGEKIELIASGRTDSGVHSLGQTANFKTNSQISIEKFPLAINSKLKQSIRIKSAEEVDERFHSRYSVKFKKYRYTINNSEYGSAIYRDFEYHFPVKLDVEKMKCAAKLFEGEHDFKAFKASGTSSKLIRFCLNLLLTAYHAEEIIFHESPDICRQTTDILRRHINDLIPLSLDHVQSNSSHIGISGTAALC